MARPETQELACSGVAPTACVAASTTGRGAPTPATVATRAAVTTEISPDLTRRLLRVRPLDHRLQQYLAARADIGLGRVLDLVVADAVLARHEDHGRRRHARDIAGVVSRAAHDVHVGVPRLLRPAPHGLHEFPGEGRRREVPDLLYLGLETMALGDVVRRQPHLGIHFGELVIVGMAEIQRHEDAARDGVARLRLAFDHAHGRPSVQPVADLARRHDQLRRADQRVAPAFHGRGAGVAFHAGPRDLVPALALRARDDADRLLLALEDRPLLDMRLEERANQPAAHRLLAVLADLPQRLAKAHAVAVLDVESMVEREGAA